MAEAFITSRLQGRRILIVKNDYLQAQKLVELMQNQGAEVAGPAASVEKAIGVLLKDPLPNMLVLDVRLGREKVFPLAESLKTIGIPFVFASSSRSWSLPEACEGALHCKKPLDERELLRTLAMLSRVKASTVETAD